MIWWGGVNIGVCTCHNVPEPGWNRPDTVSIGPIPALFWYMFADYTPLIRILGLCKCNITTQIIYLMEISTLNQRKGKTMHDLQGVGIELSVLAKYYIACWIDPASHGKQKLLYHPNSISPFRRYCVPTEADLPVFHRENLDMTSTKVLQNFGNL